MQCPVCGNQYTDPSLRYCLADGTALVPADEEETLARRDAVRVDIPPAESTRQPARAAVPQTRRTSAAVKIILGLLALLTVLIVVAVAGVLLLLNFRGTGANDNKKNPSPTPAASVTPSADAEKERLQKELANAQQKINEQKNANHPVNTAPFPVPSQSGIATARVNSPRDGFLALRNEPDADYGERLVKIPHGAVVTLEDCQRQRVTVSGRSGRWCMVTYEGTTGWVFDAWLDYER